MIKLFQGPIIRLDMLDNSIENKCLEEIDNPCILIHIILQPEI